ncbi:hypothetical protein HYV82_06060 [Candidatus Woesearchaeota archaeon]|nr:hypothetical protein [Candidatus Woesearchaeota archaeon]
MQKKRKKQDKQSGKKQAGKKSNRISYYVLIAAALLLTFLLFLIARPQTPPEPGSPGAVGQARAAVAGYAEPKNFEARPSNKLVFQLLEDSADAKLSVSSYDFAYKKGYYLKNSQWEAFDFSETPISGSNWIRLQGTKDLIISRNEVEEGTDKAAFLAYACNRTASGWDCNGNKWMIYTLDVLKKECDKEGQYQCEGKTLKLCDSNYKLVTKETCSGGTACDAAQGKCVEELPPEPSLPCNKDSDCPVIVCIAVSGQRCPVNRCIDNWCVATGEGTAETSVKLATPGNFLELGENLTSVLSSVTGSDLSALKDGSITNQYGTFTYTQVIDLPKYAYVRYLKDTSNGAGTHIDDEPFDYLVLPINSTTQSTHVYNLRLSFSPALKSDHSTSTTNHLKGVENKTIRILGKNYEIMEAAHPAYGVIRMTLVPASGGEKIVLEDTMTFTKGAGGTVTIGSTDSSNVKVDIVTATDTGLNDSSSKVEISSIDVYYDASEALYVGKGESASEIADAVEGEKGVFFLNGFDYKYEGLSTDSREEIKLKPIGSNNYALAFTNKAGVHYDIFIFGLIGNSIILGQSTSETTGHALILSEARNISDEDFFLVSRNKYSRILQFRGVDSGNSSTDNTGTAKFMDTGTGDIIEAAYSGLKGNLALDGNTYLIQVSNDTEDASLQVDLDGSGAIGSNSVGVDSNNGIYTLNEAYITFPQANLMQITTPQDEDNQRNTIGVVMTVTSDAKLDISYVNGSFDDSGESTSASTGIYQRGDAQKYEGYSYSLADDGVSKAQYGVRALWDKKSTTATDQDDVTFWIGNSPIKAYVVITAEAPTEEVCTDSDGGNTVTVPL